VALMVSGPVLSLVDVADNYTSLAWLPLVLWCAVSNAGPRLSALVIAMSFLAGEPLFAAIGALAFALLRWRTPWAVLGTGVAAFGLVAVQALPFLEMLRGSDRSEAIAEDLLLRDSLAPADWLRIVVPPHLHSNIADVHLHQQFIPIVYCGVIVVLFAIVAVVSSLRRRDAQLALGVVALAFILGAGKYLTPVGWMWVHLPVKVLRYPARFLSLAAIAIAFLAAVGWEWLSQRVTWRWLGFAVVAAVALDGVVRTQPLFAHRPFQPNPVPHPLGVGRDGFFVRVRNASNAERRTWIDGYLNLLDQRFDAVSPAPVTNARYNTILRGVSVQRLSMMSVRYILTETPLPAPLVPIDTYQGVTAYQNRGAFPLGYFHGDDGRYAAVSFMSIGTSFVRIEVRAPSSGVVVVAQQSAPGWEVSVDGRRSDATTLVNGIFRAVRVSRGPHTVEWKYRPLSLRVGAAISLLALVWLLFGLRAMRPTRAFVKR